MSERRTFKSKPHIVARCQDCGWTLQSVNAIGVAAQHSDRYGHQVDLDVEFTMSFRRSGNIEANAKES